MSNGLKSALGVDDKAAQKKADDAYMSGFLSEMDKAFAAEKSALAAAKGALSSSGLSTQQVLKLADGGDPKSLTPSQRSALIAYAKAVQLYVKAMVRSSWGQTGQRFGGVDQKQVSRGAQEQVYRIFSNKFAAKSGATNGVIDGPLLMFPKQLLKILA